MFDKRKGQAEPEIETTSAAVPADTQSFNTRSTAMIGKSIVVKGNITGDENLVIEGTALLGFVRALLAHQRVFVHPVATNIVAFRHNFCGLQHRHISRRVFGDDGWMFLGNAGKRTDQVKDPFFLADKTDKQQPVAAVFDALTSLIGGELGKGKKTEEKTFTIPGLCKIKTK